MKLRIVIILMGLLCYSQVFAQIDQDSTINNQNQNSDLIIQETIVPVDSTAIIARENFVRDSLFRRKLIVDSLTFLKQELPKLFQAALKSINEEIILFTDPVDIIGDSTLSNFTTRLLLQNLDQPYAPWRSSIKLSGSSLKLKIDTINKKVVSIRSPEINYSFAYNSDKRIVRMDGSSTILKKRTGNYYKYPIDSVFFDNQGRVKKLKKYAHYFEATSDYKKGASLYVDLTQIKEFEYFPDGVLSNYRLVNYCDRWGGVKINEVCQVVNYSITRQGGKYTVLRKNEPKDDFSDGTFIFEIDNNFDMKSMEYIKVDKTLSRKCIIELNEDKYVSRYLYENNGAINKTLLIDYNKNPNAKNKFETTSCFFEKDGISYYQKNNTTGKSRTRDKLTMVWGPWQ